MNHNDMPNFWSDEPDRCINCGGVDFLRKMKDGTALCETCIQRENDAHDQAQKEANSNMYNNEASTYECPGL